MENNYKQEAILKRENSLIQKQRIYSLFLGCMVFLCANQTVAQTISYSFANAQITYDGANRFYEADIMLSTDTDFQLGLGQFYIDYNTDAFGTNIFGANLTFSHPAAPAAGDAEYILDQDAFDAISLYGTVLANNTSSKLSIAWTQSQNSTFYPTITAADSPHKLAHIKIQYADINEDANIAFDTALSEDLTFNISSTPLAGDGAQITDDSYNSSEVTPAFVWTGDTDGDWSTADNWSANLVPDGTRKSFIPSGLTNYPTATGAAAVSSLTIASGASFIAQAGFTGTVTYNRTLGSSNWYLISSPVVGQDEDDFVTAAGLQASVDNPGNIALGSYITVSNTWSYYNGSTGVATLDSGAGYTANLAAVSGDISFTGTLNTDNVNGVTISTAGDGFNLVGNPYTSYINSETFLDANTNLDAQVWTWNPNDGFYTARPKVDAFMLAPGQGFLIKANSGSTVDFAESNQAHNASDTFQRNNDTRTEVHLLMTDGTNDRFAKIYYIEGTTTGFDNGYEGEIFGGIPNSLDLYTELVANSIGKKYQIQSLPDADFENMIIPVGVNSDAGTVSFSTNTLNLPTGYKVYLEDKDTGNFIRLDDGSIYDVTFTAAVYGIGRFFIHVTTSTLSTNSFDLTNVSTYLSAPNNLKVLGIHQGTTQVRLFNILGKQVLSTSFQANGANDVPLPSLRQGVYIVQINAEYGKINKKIFIE